MLRRQNKNKVFVNRGTREWSDTRKKASNDIRMSHIRTVKIRVSTGRLCNDEENENHKFMSDSSFFGVFGVFYVRTMRLVQFMTYNYFQKSRMIETCTNCQQLPIRSARYATWMDLYFHVRKSDSNDNERPDYRVCTTCVLQRHCQWSTWLLLFFPAVIWIWILSRFSGYGEWRHISFCATVELSACAGTEAVPKTAHSTGSVPSPQRNRRKWWQRPSSEDGLIACTS